MRIQSETLNLTRCWTIHRSKIPTSIFWDSVIKFLKAQVFEPQALTKGPALVICNKLLNPSNAMIACSRISKKIPNSVIDCKHNSGKQLTFQLYVSLDQII